MYQKRRYEWDLKAFVFFKGNFLMISEPEENTVSHNSTVDKFFTHGSTNSLLRWGEEYR